MTWVNMSSAQGRLKAMIAGADKQATEPLNRRAKEAVEQMQRDVPVASGKLRDSIKATPKKGGATIEAGEKYAWFVENGTMKMGARPFFRPAIETMRRNLDSDFKNFLKGLTK